MEKTFFLTVLGQSLSLSKITLYSHMYLLYRIIHFSVNVYNLVNSGLSGMVFLPRERSEKINTFHSGKKSPEI